MTKKNLILDLDNTLYDYDSPHKIALSASLHAFSTKFKLPIDQTRLCFDRARQNTHLELPSRAASHNRLLYFQKMLEYNRLNSLHYALELYELYWDTFLANMTLNDKVLEYLEKVQSKGGKICILTDLTAHIQYRKINKLGLSEYVNYLVTSEEVGVEKPHPSMFLKAMQKLRCEISDALMVGDSWSKDIIGANALGMQSIWINLKKENRKITGNIREIAEFKEIDINGEKESA